MEYNKNIRMEEKVYTCPMHPEVQRSRAGLCPECGMNLVPGGAMKHEHDAHAGHHTNIFKRKFWASLVLSVPVVLYSEIIPTLTGWHPPVFFGSSYLPAILASVIFFYGGWVFFTSAVRELRARLPGMMTLIALATLTAYSYSVVETFRGSSDVLYWELSTLIVVMLLGHWMEMRAVSGAQNALKALSELLPDTAEVIRDGVPQSIPLAQVRAGDHVLIRPGATVPADGAVVEGSSDINEALATGESRPVPKRVGDNVIAGTTNGDGALTVQVSAIGEHTFLAGVMRLVADAQASKSRLQLVSDRAALWLTIIAVLTGSFTLVWWLAAHAGAGFAIQRFVAVLVITCPHALGLAVPLVASISTTKAARNGFLVRSRLALEAARNIQVVVFDKTGTLTTGTFAVTATSSDRTLQLAASVDARSEHPIAKAVVAEAHRRGLTVAPSEDYQRLPGVGGQAMVAGKKVFVGHRDGPDLVVEEDGAVVGSITVADAVRPESRQAVQALQALGVRVVMMTGDAQEVARSVADTLGVDEFFARVLPGAKAQKVKELQQRGLRVAMVGDGINDAPALAQADVGIAIGAGTNVAIESAGIILVKNDPRDIAKIIRLSKLTYTKMVQNLFWATGYNVAAIPLAAGVLASRGFLLQPAVSAALMSVSTIIVSANALLLRRRAL